MFLIHRVELKAGSYLISGSPILVSNSPCGVERPYSKHEYKASFQVSNSPCGVERFLAD